MKKTFLCLLSLTVLIGLYFTSCNSDKKKTNPAVGQARILAIYTDTVGNKTASIVLRIIAVNPVFNPSENKYEVVTDTIFGVEQRIAVLDSLKKPKLDSAGKQVYQFGWVKVNKESINTHVENIPLDSLTKKN